MRRLIRWLVGWLWSEHLNPYGPVTDGPEDEAELAPPQYCPPLLGAAPQPADACVCPCHHAESADLCAAQRQRDLAEQRGETAPDGDAKRVQVDRFGRFSEEVFHASQAVLRRTSLGVLGPERAHPVAAALACPACRALHTVALSGRPPELGTRRPKLNYGPRASSGYVDRNDGGLPGAKGSGGDA